MNRKLLVIDLWLWIFLSIFVISGSFSYHISSKKVKEPLKLIPSEMVEVNVFRVFKDVPRLSLEFNLTENLETPELGRFVNTGDAKKNGYLNFLEPGEPVKLKVEIEGEEQIFEALPKANMGIPQIRYLTPFVEDNNPQQFPWSSNPGLLLELDPGFTTLNVTVLDVGESLRGEHATLTIRPPIGTKIVANNYRMLVYGFILWPLYILFLVVYGLILLRRFKRHRLDQTD